MSISDYTPRALNDNRIKVLHVTPLMAQAFLSFAFEGQRDTSPVQVAMYANDMATGKWRAGDGLIIIGVRPSRNCLIAGKHRLSAVVKSGVTVPFLVEWRDYETDEDMYQDYASTNRGKKLTQGQALVSLSTQEVLGVSKQIVDTSAAAMKIIASGFEGRRNDMISSGQPLQNPSTMHEVLVSWKNPIYAYSSAIAHAERGQYRWFLRSPVAAICITTFRFCPDAAEPFWREVAANNGLVRGTPQHALRSFLSTNAAPNGGDSIRNYLQKIARFWCLHRQGKAASYAKPTERFTLLGIPWDGKSNPDGLAILGVK